MYLIIYFWNFITTSKLYKFNNYYLTSASVLAIKYYRKLLSLNLILQYVGVSVTNIGPVEPAESLNSFFFKQT